MRLIGRPPNDLTEMEADLAYLAEHGITWGARVVVNDEPGTFVGLLQQEHGVAAVVMLDWCPVILMSTNVSRLEVL